MVEGGEEMFGVSAGRICMDFVIGLKPLPETRLEI